MILDWWNHAKCKNAKSQKPWFPDAVGQTATGRKVCVGCLVQKECLKYAMDHHIVHGIWGGKSERERRKIRKLNG